MAVREIKQMPNVVSLFTSLNLTRESRLLLEQVVAGVALKVGGAKSLFANVNFLQDYVTDVELIGNPLPVLTKPNSHLNLRTEPQWPQTNETLSMPVGIITFSNDD